MIPPGLVVAYHGCDVTVRDDLVTGKLAHLIHSNNPYDWLGPGSYFFENDLERAYLFAKASADAPQQLYTAKPIATPAVVGAVLNVSNWLDMTHQQGIQLFKEADEALVSGLERSNAEVPMNAPAYEGDVDILHRSRDRAVFIFIHHAQPEAFDAVRGAFAQGDYVSDNSGFRLRTHVQIALRNDQCVLGWFLPAQAKLLHADDYAAAKQRLNETQKVVTAAKRLRGRALAAKQAASN